MTDQPYQADSAPRQADREDYSDPIGGRRDQGFRHIWDIARPEVERAVAKIIGGEK